MANQLGKKEDRVIKTITISLTNVFLIFICALVVNTAWFILI
jgi:hypothetical protein